MTSLRNDFGISLTGGGARGSYQAGVLRGLSEILKEQNLLGVDNPFKHWSGVSAGSINAAFCCAGINNFEGATDRLVNVWKKINPEDVYRTDFTSLGKNSVRWIRDLTFGSVLKNKLARSLLDTEPLLGLLERNIQFENIQGHINSGLIKGLACSAYCYYDNRTVTFMQSNENVTWDRERRISRKIDIKAEHVVASCAIPMLFPAAKIGGEYFADGSFRNLSPISPILHMGSKKILVIGVRGQNEFSEKTYRADPSVARIAGAILNALFFDTIEVDLERVRHINDMVAAAKGSIETHRSDYSHIDFIYIRPSVDVSLLAVQKAKSFPKFIDFLLGGLGPIEESAELASYILFVSSFTRELIEIGYMDTMEQKNTLLQWLGS